MGLKTKLKNKALGYKATSDSYIAQLRRSGVKVGTDVKFFRPYNTTIDMQNPHLLTIGDHVMITGPVTVLTHDYSWSVLKNKYGYVAGNQKPVKIGNNVFIGWGATILAGTTVGDNTIIGANKRCFGKARERQRLRGKSREAYYEHRRILQKKTLPTARRGLRRGM
jgi:maltose O-acetyltransferase